MIDSSLVDRLPQEADRVLIVANPKAGAGPGRDRVEQLVAALAKYGFSTTVLHDLSEVAARAAEVQQTGRLRAVVAAGGDGTVCEVLNRAPPGAPVAILALGTENLLARYLDMPRSPAEVAEVIAAGAIVRHDAGVASGRLFALMLGCGFDADVIRRLHEARQGHIRRWTYLKPIWDTIRSYDYPELRIYWGAGDEPNGAAGGESNQQMIRAKFAFVFNIPRYALGLRFTPAAVGDDGWLDVCTFRRGSFLWGLWYFVNLVVRRHKWLADCTLHQARRLRIEADVPVPYNLDGDHGGWLPLEVEILPGRLTFVAPPGWVARRSAPRAPALAGRRRG